MTARLADGSRSQAVIFGASRFFDDALHDLPGVDNNLADIHALLCGGDSWRLPPENCRLLPNPARRDVGRAINHSAAIAEDTLIIYYAGHGLPSDRSKLYLSLPDTDHELPEFTALDFALIRRALANAAAKNRILILDCCYSGRAIEGMGDAASVIATETEIFGTYTLTSSSRNRPSVAPTGARHTAFTGALLELIGHGIQDGPELLTFHDLFRPIYARQSSAGLPTPRSNGSDLVHDLAFVRNVAAHTVAPEEPAVEVEAVTTDAVLATESGRRLNRNIESLRAFERETRSRLQHYLEGQVQSLEAQPHVADLDVVAFVREYHARLESFFRKCQEQLEHDRPPPVFVLDRKSEKVEELEAFAHEYHRRLSAWLGSLLDNVNASSSLTQGFEPAAQRRIVEDHMRGELERLAAEHRS